MDPSLSFDDHLPVFISFAFICYLTVA